MKINKNIHTLLQIAMIVLVLAMVGAAILQLFFPSFLGTTTAYGLNAGWQREIGFWNLGVIGILVGTLWKGNGNTAIIVAIGGLILPIGFGLNHLFAFFHDTSMYMSIVGAIENFLLALFLTLGVAKQARWMKQRSHTR